MIEPPPDMPSADDLAVASRALQALARRPELCDTDERAAELCDLAGRLLRARRDQVKREGRQRDREVLDAAGIRAPATPPPNPLPEAERGSQKVDEKRKGAGSSIIRLPLSASGRGLGGGVPSPLAGVICQLSASRNCYVCKAPYTRRHAFYDQLCPPCGDLNYSKRDRTADLRGQVAIVTGARIKIGFHVALKLLRAGARVEAITRFPCDAARRYAQEADFAEWANRLRLHAIDLRHLPAVERFAAGLCANLDRLDVVVNNAAQTVRRPPAFYRHLLEGEGLEALPSSARHLLAGPPVPALLTQLPLLPGDDTVNLIHFPPGAHDRHGQQLDLRDRTSWSLQLGEVELAELVEVHAINCLAPFVLLRQLEPLLLRHAGVPRFVINVAASEGQFNGADKNGRHPHTNMSKAALNMLTRTCAGPYAEHGVFVNSVDTGWVSNEAPRPRAERMTAQGFREPLDLVDAAARVLDPVFGGLREHGKLWKDYRPVPW